MISGPLEPVTNRETITLDIEFVDDETGEFINLDDVTEIVIQVVPRNDGRSSDYGFNGANGYVALTAKLSNGDISEIQPAVIHVRFTASVAAQLCSGTYDIGGTLTKDDETVQFLLGQLPVLNGIVSR